jgi:hypothetical protein
MEREGAHEGAAQITRWLLDGRSGKRGKFDVSLKILYKAKLNK